NLNAFALDFVPEGLTTINKPAMVPTAWRPGALIRETSTAVRFFTLLGIKAPQFYSLFFVASSVLP
ncbi:MAG TPA: hypothetical protein DCR95_11000, partial [Desulfobacter sp.]|nr:hypothetical protein [Desulfobacter sp.]